MYIERGFYDFTTLDENDDIKVIDVVDIIDNIQEDGFSIRRQRILENFVIKCNICNFSFVTILQFLVHNDSKDHRAKFLDG